MIKKNKIVLTGEGADETSYDKFLDGHLIKKI